MVAGTKGPMQKVEGMKGGCSQEDLQVCYPGGSGNNESAVSSTDGGLHWGHHTEGWEKKDTKAWKTYGGATQEGVATAIVQGGLTDGGMHQRPHAELGKER
jgi:hypothetical protein